MPTRTPLALESLETREVPATIQLDYSLDALGFFNDPARRAVLQQAANDVASKLDASLPALASGGGNSWTARFFNPSTGSETQIPDLAVPANTVILFAGGRDLTGTEAGVGGYGGYSASGNQAWFDSIQHRGPFGLWGGSLTFDTFGTNWFFGATTAGLGAAQLDFYSAAVHEITHALGVGTSPQWHSLSSGGLFTGASSEAVYGGPVPLGPDGDHWREGITVGGAPVSMDPYAALGVRVTTSTLDYAALKDIGWTVNGVSGVSVPPPPAFTPVQLPTRGDPVVLTGAADGTAQVFTAAADGTLTAAGPKQNPFPGFTGVVRSVTGDFNGDGTVDFAFATGAGTQATIRVFDGKTGADLVPQSFVLDGFQGGVFIAAGDVDRDGVDELAVSADAGGGTRVSVYKFAGGVVTTVADVLAFGDPGFRGGSRVALGDVNRDGAADLIVGAGTGGGPRVAVYDGLSVAAGKATRLVPDFFALDASLRSGVYVAAADVNGDGAADVLYSTGTTGGPRVRVVSGAVVANSPGGDMAAAPALADFFTWDANDRGGIRIATKDVDGDGRAELIVGSANKTTPMVRVIPFTQFGTPTTAIANPFGNAATIDGLYVG